MAKRAVVTAVVLVVHLALLGAQAAPIKLVLEVLKNGQVIAHPSIEVAPSATGNVTIDGVGKFGFTPTVRDADHIAVALDIESADRHFSPRLVIGPEPGSVSWADKSDLFELRVGWTK